jgi:hypothetical protein
MKEIHHSALLVATTSCHHQGHHVVVQTSSMSDASATRIHETRRIYTALNNLAVSLDRNLDPTLSLDPLVAHICYVESLIVVRPTPRYAEQNGFSLLALPKIWQKICQTAPSFPVDTIFQIVAVA